jgi:hypothetical protein
MSLSSRRFAASFRFSLAFSLASALLVAAATPAHAFEDGVPLQDPPEPFAYQLGHTGQIVGGVQGSMGVSDDEHVTTSHTTATSGTITADVFVVGGLSFGVGSTLSYHHTRVDDAPLVRSLSKNSHSVSTIEWEIQPHLRLGFYLPLANRLALWPVASVGTEWVFAHADGYEARGPSLHVSGELGVIVPIVEHLFVRVAPRIERRFGDELAGDGVETRLALGVGGYF